MSSFRAQGIFVQNVEAPALAAVSPELRCVLRAFASIAAAVHASFTSCISPLHRKVPISKKLLRNMSQVTMPVLTRGLNDKNEEAVSSKVGGTNLLHPHTSACNFVTCLQVKRTCCLIVDNMCKLVEDPAEAHCEAC